MDPHDLHLLVFRKAILSGDAESVQKMLLKNPKLTQSTHLDQNGFSFLWQAMVYGHEEIIELLIKFGANIYEGHTIEKNKRLTFFQWMAMSNDPEELRKNERVAKILVKRGADVNKTYDEYWTSPLEIAVSNGDLQSVQFFLKNNAKIEDPEYLIELLASAESKNTQKEILLLLLDNGLDISFHNENGCNLLHIICKTGKYFSNIVEIAEVLLNAGVQLNELDNDGFSPLHWAIFETVNLELATFLIKKGADVNLKREVDGKSPLSAVITSGSNKHKEFEDLIELILSKGADANAIDKNGRTALHEARYNEAIFKLLISKGAKPGIHDNDDNTPFSEVSSENFEFWPNEYHTMHTWIEELAKLTEMGRSDDIGDADWDVMSTRSLVDGYFNSCSTELTKMEKTVFYPPYSYLCVLKMSTNITELAKLTKNKKFVSSFEANLPVLSFYGDELREIFDEALQVRDQFPMVYSRLYSIFRKVLPDVVIRELAGYLTLKELPME